jgi:site-specific DNA-methyltransferase (adenine-specific)
MQIIERRISDIKPYEKNPRRNDAAVEYVAESLRQFGWKQPIVIDKDGVIIAGHTRYKAALSLGMETAPCLIADDLTPEQVKAYRLADNKVAEASEWDMELLDAELAEIMDALPEFDMADFGFDLDDVSPDEQTEAAEDDYDAQPPAEPKTKRGDVYQLGRHRLMCGDSTNEEDMCKLMNGQFADMVFTDPPYGVAIGNKNKALNAVQKAGRHTENILGDTMTEAGLYSMLKAAFVNVRKACADDAVYFVTSPQGGSLGLMMMMMMRDAGLEVRHVLMWEKNSATFSIGRLDYDYQHEPIFYTWTKSHHNYRGGEYRTTIWKYDKPRKADLHPTMKPVKLVANAMLDGTKENMIVLDAFGGSGTTMIAAEQLGRNCYMMELEPRYCDVIVDRWERLTGEKAVLIQ